MEQRPKCSENKRAYGPNLFSIEMFVSEKKKTESMGKTDKVNMTKCKPSCEIWIKVYEE